MLEPLIVLTVLNCFFMFSSTATTCALWWQYRSHRCCYKKDTAQQAARHALSKLKSSHASKNPKKGCTTKQDNPGNGADRSKSNSTLNRDSKSSRRRQKRSSSTKHPVHSESPSEEHENSMDIEGEWHLEERTRMSEASQTGNDVRPAVVMEYSTVQKIVQILDDDADLLTTRMAIKDLQAKQHAEEKKADLDAEINDKLERPSLTAYAPSES